MTGSPGPACTWSRSSSRAPAPPRVSAVEGMEEQLRIQDRVAQAMRAVRHQHGALGLETIEARAVFDGDVISDLVPDEKNRAKELIEDFMIAANGAIAKTLEAKGFPSLRRVLRSPERWDRIVVLAAGLGERLPPEPDTAGDPRRPRHSSFPMRRTPGTGDANRRGYHRRTRRTLRPNRKPRSGENRLWSRHAR